MISIPNQGCYATTETKKKSHKHSESSPVIFLPPFHLFLAAQITNYCQVHLIKCKCETQTVLLQYQYLDIT